MQVGKLPIISIVGTTSVGKSEAVIALAEYALEQKIASGVCIISADSRQVYQGLEVLTGADIPTDFQEAIQTFENVTSVGKSDENIPKKYYTKTTNYGVIDLYGISIVSPFEEWSVGRFNEYASVIIRKAQQEEKLVLVVGGTGLYHQHLLTTDPRLQIPPNTELREKLQALSLFELQSELEQLNPTYFAQLNNSDRHNPRRLQRAIEVERALQYLHETDPEVFDAFLEQQQAAHLKTAQHKVKHIYLGLYISLELLHKKITQRVAVRFTHGAVKEVSKVLDDAQQTQKTVSAQAATTLGFAEIKKYLEGVVTEQECLQSWIQADFSYSKRQLTWWKKYGAVQWFNREESSWQTALLRTFTTSLK